ncbi:ribonuclease P protein subunit p20-like [Dysidea avara]|uniref:ribonuclease P protein subunit p20-like n=1 Tax=Dysidea avara TaxID=196820 RepID=UPI00332D84FC
MATSGNDTTSQPLSGTTGKKRARKPKQKADVIKKNSSGVGTHVMRKHPPSKLSKRKNDIYINRRTEFPVQLVRCTKLLEEGYNEITIHGLGAAINRAINLALKLQDTSPYELKSEVTTSTVEVMDEFEPLEDDQHYQSQSRNTSAIHIKLSRTNPSLVSHT